MIWPQLLPFVITALLIEITPGPNMGYLSVVALSHGRRAAFAVVAGVALGLLVVGAAAALGVAEIVARSPLLYDVLRYGGVAYLLWLAFEAWQDSSDDEADIDASHQGDFFRRGLITNLLNPKAGLFYVATLPQFLPAPLPGHPHGEIVAGLTLTVIYVVIATAIHAVVVMLAGQAGVFARSERARLHVRRGMAVALALIAVWLGFSTAR